MLENPVIISRYDKVLILFLAYGSACVSIFFERGHFSFEDLFINKEDEKVGSQLVFGFTKLFGGFNVLLLLFYHFWEALQVLKKINPSAFFFLNLMHGWTQCQANGDSYYFLMASFSCQFWQHFNRTPTLTRWCTE